MVSVNLQPQQQQAEEFIPHMMPSNSSGVAFTLNDSKEGLLTVGGGC